MCAYAHDCAEARHLYVFVCTLVSLFREVTWSPPSLYTVSQHTLRWGSQGSLQGLSLLACVALSLLCCLCVVACRRVSSFTFLAAYMSYIHNFGFLMLTGEVTDDISVTVDIPHVSPCDACTVCLYLTLALVLSAALGCFSCPHICVYLVILQECICEDKPKGEIRDFPLLSCLSPGLSSVASVYSPFLLSHPSSYLCLILF